MSFNTKASAHNYQHLNETASCDSTCYVPAGEVKLNSSYKQRIIACPFGFKGMKSEYSVKSHEGQWSDWFEQDVSQCICEATYENSVGTCPLGQKGEIQLRRDWVCSPANTGSWTSFYVTNNTCYTPCTPLPSQMQTSSCAAGYTGVIVQMRSSFCSSDDKKPPTWTAWTTTSNSCIPTLSPATPWATYFSGTFKIYIANNVDVNVKISPDGTVSGSGINEWCTRGSSTTLPSNHVCPSGYSYISANITIDGSVYWNGNFNTTWRANYGGAKNTLQANGSSNGSYIYGTFLSNEGTKIDFTASRISY